MYAAELTGPDPFKNMNPEFGPRFEAAQRGDHAPGKLCECTQHNGGVKGTFILKPVLIEPRFYGWEKYKQKHVWVSFENLDATQRRMCCYGAGQTPDGDWRHMKTQVPIAAHIKAIRAAKLRNMAWRGIPNAIWAVFRLMEDAAKHAEERRIAQIALVLAAAEITEAGMQTISQVLEL